MFKKFFIISRNSKTYDFYFPHDTFHSNAVEKPFLYPCTDFERYEHGIYVVVLTEISGNKNFITTRFIKENSISIAFESDHPWFEIIYCIINNILKSQLYLPSNWTLLDAYLNNLLCLPYPEPGVVFYIPDTDFNSMAVKIVVPMKSRQKPFSVFIMSLHKQMQFIDWIIIFESLLMERWIVFHSRHLNRVTNCIFAALSLIFPLEWVHLIFPCLSEESITCLGCPSPFVAGVHSCLIDKVLPILSVGTLIVNIDEGTLNFVTCDSDPKPEGESIPRCLVYFLLRNVSDNELKICESRKITNNDEKTRKACRLVVNGFLNAMAVLLGKYKSCTIWKEETNRYYINKNMLAQSRGDVLQSFLSKVLQSQMVHQFLDDKINQSVSDKLELTFAVDDIDDFEEACKDMNRWQPDHYTEVIANMASRSRRKINDFAVKVRDMAKKTAFTTEAFENGSSRFTSSIDDSQSLADNSPIKQEIDVSRNHWITFEDNETKSQDLFSCHWTENKPLEEEFVFQFENSNNLRMTPDGNIEQTNDLPRLMKDFDPFYTS